MDPSEGRLNICQNLELLIIVFRAHFNQIDVNISRKILSWLNLT